MVSLLLVGLSVVAYVVFLDAFGAAMESLVVFVIVVVFVAASLYHRARGVRGGRSP
jgi:succinate dehydrogenase/fumarate reductase cytochrome b subunit